MDHMLPQYECSCIPMTSLVGFLLPATSRLEWTVVLVKTSSLVKILAKKFLSGLQRTSYCAEWNRN